MQFKREHSDFNREKAIEVIIYLAERIPEADLYSVGKLLYFADKTSLERFGRFICGESYVAMQKGPVPSNVYDIMKEAVDDGSNGFIVENDYYVKSLRPADLDKLSDSDIQCLDQIIELFGQVPNWIKRDISHDEAYYEAWNARGRKKSAPMSIESIARILEDADDLIEHLHCKTDG